MHRFHFVIAALLLVITAPCHAALNAYAKIFIDGGQLNGDVTLGSIGGIDVSSGYIEIYQIEQSQVIKEKSVPITIQKRIDQTSPIISDAIANESVVEGQILIFDNDPNSGETRHRTSIYFSNALIVESKGVLPDAFDAEESNRPPVEYVKFVAESFSIVEEINVGGGWVPAE